MREFLKNISDYSAASLGMGFLIIVILSILIFGTIELIKAIKKDYTQMMNDDETEEEETEEEECECSCHKL